MPDSSASSAPSVWNQGRSVGPRSALTPVQAQAIDASLQKKAAWHDRCLFRVAVDSMLRCSDLLALRVEDVMTSRGVPREQIRLRQTKTQQPVCAVLTPGARQACRQWAEHSVKQPGHFLFTRCKPVDSKPISDDRYRHVLKDWVEAIGLDSADYSSHSLRRTKPVFLYKKGVAIEDIALLLGHQDPRSTLRYLGLTLAHAQAEALKHDIFGSRGKHS